MPASGSALLHSRGAAHCVMFRDWFISHFAADCTYAGVSRLPAAFALAAGAAAAEMLLLMS